jgi:hypothetical protein
MSSEMNDEMSNETNSETPSPKSLRRPRPRRTGVLLAALVIIVSLAIVALTTLNYRPQWRSLTGTHEPKDAALVMDCPENWMLSEVPGMANNQSFSRAFSSVLALKMRPLTGLPAWWQKYILRQENTSNDNITVVAYAMRDPSLIKSGSTSTGVVSATPLAAKPRTRAEAEKMLDGFENGFRHFQPRGPFGNTPISFRRVEHSLGPALEMDLDRTAPVNRLPNAPARAGMWHTHILYIAPLTAPPDNGMVLVSCSLPTGQYAFMKPTVERMFRSTRLVRK